MECITGCARFLCWLLDVSLGCVLYPAHLCSPVLAFVAAAVDCEFLCQACWLVGSFTCVSSRLCFYTLLASADQFVFPASPFLAAAVRRLFPVLQLLPVSCRNIYIYICFSFSVCFRTLALRAMAWLVAFALASPATSIFSVPPPVRSRLFSALLHPCWPPLFSA